MKKIFIILSLISSQVFSQSTDTFELRSFPHYDEYGNLYTVTEKFDHLPTREDSLKFEKESRIIIYKMMDEESVRFKPRLQTMEQFVSNWLGKPYRYGGTSINGIDCSAFVRRLYKDVYGYTIPRTCIKQFNFVRKVSPDSLVVGDLLFFSSRVSPSGWHVGVYIGNDEFIHAANFRDGVKISCLDEYSRILKGVGRIN
jgi:hypothetical protein